MRNSILPLAMAGAISLCLSPAMAHVIEEPVQPPTQGTSRPEATPTQSENRTSQIVAKWFGNFNGILGAQTMQNSGWKDDDKGTLVATGFDMDLGKAEWPVNLYIGSHTGIPKDQRMDSENYNLTTFKFGPRYYLEKKGGIRPYLTAGVAMVESVRSWNEGMHRSSSQSEETFGVFANAGVIFKLGRFFHIGLDITVVNSGKLDGNSDSNHLRAGVVLGAGSE
ncbi:MAG: porin family protein [Nitrospinota bacterium]|nr:porin family protein [Nitrospinota bacterium]